MKLSRFRRLSAVMLGLGTLTAAMSLTACTESQELIASISVSPNPFSPESESTQITSTFSSALAADTTIIDATIQIATTTYGEVYGVTQQISLPAGETDVVFVWDGQNNAGEDVYPGLYVVGISLRIAATQDALGAVQQVGGGSAFLESTVVVQ